MGFFSWKQTCGICGKDCNLNRWRVKKDKSWLCPNCFKKMGGIANIEYLSTKTIEEIREIIDYKNIKTVLSQISIDDFAEPIKTENCASKSLNFKVAGVTFKSGRRSRQIMLKNMYFKNTPPFDSEIKITFERYEFNGQLAIGVYANGLQIGDVPQKIIDKFNSYWTCNYTADFSIIGGGELTWGCVIDVVFD